MSRPVELVMDVQCQIHAPATPGDSSAARRWLPIPLWNDPYGWFDELRSQVVRGRPSTVLLRNPHGLDADGEQNLCGALFLRDNRALLNATATFVDRCAKLGVRLLVYPGAPQPWMLGTNDPIRAAMECYRGARGCILDGLGMFPADSLHGQVALKLDSMFPEPTGPEAMANDGMPWLDRTSFTTSQFPGLNLHAPDRLAPSFAPLASITGQIIMLPIRHDDDAAIVRMLALGISPAIPHWWYERCGWTQRLVIERVRPTEEATT